MTTSNGHEWQGRWIRTELPADPQTHEHIAAPWIRGRFTWNGAGRKALAFIACPGWHEFYVNGKRPDDRVLSPAPMQFSHHIPYLVYDVTGLLRPGRNEIRVLLGNGWFNPFNADAWNFHAAVWRYPKYEPVKLRFDLEIDGSNIACSDTTWEYYRSAIIFNSLRNGEYYDARLENTEDGEWQPVVAAVPPPGLLCEEKLEPCRITRTFRPVAVTYDNEETRTTVYKFAVNLTGWARIMVSGPEGGTVQLRYGERIHADGTLDQEHIAKHIHSGAVQLDRYILAGRPQECWSPRFTYHGFQYVEIIRSEGVSLHEITAAFIHNDFRCVGRIETDHAALNRLQKMTVQSFLSNFTGIPTDCPHREKNGWTGDAQLAVETGLWNFDAVQAYKHFLQILADTQMQNGMLASIAPTSGWGTGLNPAWDMALFEIPHRVYLHTGDLGPIEDFYPAMQRYLQLCREVAANHLIHFGLGDWCCPVPEEMSPLEITSSGNYYGMLRKMALFAELLNRTEHHEHYTRLADAVKNAFLAEFHCPDGRWLNENPTVLGTVLYFGLTPAPQEDARRLEAYLHDSGFKASFGILGAKYIPRVLAEYGYAEAALHLFTQPEFPGWGYWIKQGLTTLAENWRGVSSLNHIMFGDVSAWMYQYLAGLSPLPECPGFQRFHVTPRPCGGVRRMIAEHRCRYGCIGVDWLTAGNEFKMTLQVPAGTTAVVTMPDGIRSRVGGGTHRMNCPLRTENQSVATLVAQTN